MKTNQKLKGQTAIVTGANSGIGKAVAIALAAAGAKVVVNFASDAESADKVVESIKAAGGKAFAHQADVSKEADVQEMFAAALKKFGSIDILVNNAGLQKDAPLIDLSLDDWN